MIQNEAIQRGFAVIYFSKYLFFFFKKEDQEQSISK